MNKLIFRKLSFDILAFFLLSSIAITFIVWVIQGVNLLDIVSEDGHGVKVYLIYTLLSIPKIFSKLFIFTYFLTLFVILHRYEENNEILVFWTNGIKKISFINFIGKLSVFFVIVQMILNLYLVPLSEDLKQRYLKNSTIDFFPKLIQEKKFSNLTRDLTIFVESYGKNGILEGIFIKEKIDNNESKIITASEGKLIKASDGFIFKLLDGKITNIDDLGNFDLGFKETTYELSKINAKTRQENKINETRSFQLILCLEKYFKYRKDTNLRCSKENSFLLKEIYEEMFKRAINPIYIIILSLVSSLLIIKPKKDFFNSYLKFILFSLGFTIILFSELSYKFISDSTILEMLIIALPILFIILFYFILLIRLKFRTSTL